MSSNEGGTRIASVTESLVAVIAEIIESVARIKVEQETFIEIGCYFYRIIPSIMELQTSEYTPENAIDTLQSLSGEVNVAKDLIYKSFRCNNTMSDSDLKTTIKQLEEAIKHMGDCLSTIPSSTFQNQSYAQLAVQSLAHEMQQLHFDFSHAQDLQAQETKEEHDKETEPLANEMQQVHFDFVQAQDLQAEETKEENGEETESDLYSIKLDISTGDDQVFKVPHLIEFLKKKSLSSRSKQHHRSRSLLASQQTIDYAEPLYDTFYCPLTKQVMDDPVTLESGVTYERNAILEWFKEFENSDEIFCPITGQKLSSKVLRPNIALKITIEEWEARNEAGKIKICRTALTLASSASMVFEAIRDLQGICTRKRYNKIQVCNAGILPLLVKFLEYKDRDVRCAVLELLRQLADVDDDSKEMITNVVDISTVIKLLSSSHMPIRHAALLLLLELSRSELLCQKIGSVPGGILMLVRTKYNQSVDAFSSEKADEILKNLEQSPENIKHMAENGLFDPLLNHLNQGCEEMQTEMASYLGEITLGNDSKTYVAEKASPALIQMVHRGNTLNRSSAFKSLAQISSYSPSAKILTKAGIIQIMYEEMFARRIYNEPMNSKNEAAAILANIFETGLELENLQVNSHGHKLNSDYVLYNIIHMLNNSNPEELNINLIRILLSLMKFPNSVDTIVSLVRESSASYILIEFINNPHEELGVAAIKLLIELSSQMGNMLVERLCKTRGLPENLLLGQTSTKITEKQAISAKFLAKLPHQNLTLNLALLRKNTIPSVLQTINQIQMTGMKTSRYTSGYLEGLVGVLVRFTTTLYEPEILSLARNYNLTLAFTELLMRTSSDEVQRLSAIGLENLSAESINLSKPPQMEKTKSWKQALPRFLRSSKKMKILVCPVHRGACSTQNTFCLVDAKVVDRLLACLDHENVDVVDAALSAICTLLDDKVDVDKSVSMLSEANAIRHVLNILKEHKEECLWQKSFWVIERFLMKGGDTSASDISQDRLLPATLISAFHHGNGSTRQMAEKILRHLNKVPSFPTSTFTL